MSNQLNLQIEHDESSGALVSAELASKVFLNMLAVIHELDRAVTGSARLVGWNVASAKIGSLAFGLQPYLLEPKSTVNLEFLCANHAKVIGNVGAKVQKGQASLSDDALKKVRSSIKQARDANCRLWVGIGEDYHKYEVTSQNTDLMEQWLKRSSFSIGSLEGKLELLNIHDNKKVIFAIWDYAGNKIECHYQHNTELYKEMVHGIDKRIRVFGRIKRNPNGAPRHIDVERLHVLRDSAELPTLDEMVGVIKLGVPGDEYVRSLRDA